MTKDDLMGEIITAFSEVPYPGDDNITIHPLGLDEDCYEDVKGKNWKNLKNLILHSDCIGYFTPNGFHHYLPAYLIYDLQNNMSAIFETLLYWLSYCQNNSGSPIKNISGIVWLEPRINILSKKQKEVLIHREDL